MTRTRWKAVYMKNFSYLGGMGTTLLVLMTSTYILKTALGALFVAHYRDNVNFSVNKLGLQL